MIEKNLSTYDIARRSKDKINANTITRILNGDIKEARLSTLGAIAEGLDVPIMEIVRVATEIQEPANRRELLIESFGGETLDEKYVAAIEDAIEALIAQFKKAQEREKAENEDKLSHEGMLDALTLLAGSSRPKE